MLGKWHLVAADEMNMASTKRNWPVGRGFERYYGFLGGETNQWYPDLIYDNHPVDQPSLPEDGYHLTVDLTDKAIEFIKDAKTIAPDKPFFMYFCPGATHAPHHAPKEWIEKYKGKFDMGYEAYREIVFENQKKMGIMPQDAVLSPLNPYAEETSVDGKPWHPLDVVRPWDSLSEDEKALFLAHGRGLCRLPQPRRPRDRATARLSRGVGSAGEHHRRAGLRQRRQRRRWAQRVSQREQVLQRDSRHHGGEPPVPGPIGFDRDLQPLPGGLGLGVQHPVQDVEAVQLRRRCRRPDGDLLAERDQGQRRSPRPVLSRHRHRAHHVRLSRDRIARGGQGLQSDPTRRREHPLHVR